MGLGQLLQDRLAIPEMKGVCIDSPEATAIHRDIILQKPFLKKLYLDFYASFIDTARRLSGRPGKILELGSGGGFLKDLLPEVTTSDVCPYPHLDKIVFADKLPFQAGELKAIFMLNVLHHIPESEAFFAEAVRCLAPGGRLVMIEPFNSALGRLFYKRFHHEPFDENATTWVIQSSGRLSGSNQAIPWIIFWRDRARFETLYPSLKIVSLQPHTVSRYVLSGGMSWRAFVPAFSFPFFTLADRLFSRVTPLFPMFQTIILEKQ